MTFIKSCFLFHYGFLQDSEYINSFLEYINIIFQEYIRNILIIS